MALNAEEQKQLQALLQKLTTPEESPKPDDEPAPKPDDEPAPKPDDEPAPKPDDEPAPKPDDTSAKFIEALSRALATGGSITTPPADKPDVDKLKKQLIHQLFEI